MDTPKKTGTYGKFESDLSGLAELRASRDTKIQGADAIQKLLSEIAGGMRILEDRYYNLRKKTQLTDQALIEAQRRFAKEKRILSEALVETRMKLHDLIEDIKLMKSELDDAAKNKDMITIKKYLDMWEPMEFVTRKEVEELLDDIKDKEE